MREAGRLPSAAEAQRLSDFLLAEGIDNRVDPEDDSWVLWVYEDHLLGRAKEELQRFLQNPNHESYVAAQTQANVIRKQARVEAERARKQHIEVRNRWQTPGMTRGRVTLGLMAISVAVAILTKLGAQPEPVQSWLSISPYTTSGMYISYPGLRPILSGQVWRLVTPIFLHLSFLHLLFNMLWLYQLGLWVESRLGPWRMFMLVLALAIPSNLLQYFWEGPHFGGMSGVDYGLLSYTYVKGRLAPHLGIAITQGTMLFMLGWMVLGFFGAMRMANGCHLGGLLMGGLIASYRHLPRLFAR